ncbi:unnamed protein product [Orchesella dallaii]|uniref:Uncharacterized protein n=1 Tax=Orchesella dallaii TaxID=48710 RepID=A0ABP1RVX9_9HEXA
METFNRSEYDFSSGEFDRELETLQYNSTTTTENIIKRVITENWGNLSVDLSEWQKSQLENVRESGIRCLLNMWLNEKEATVKGTYCNATWDNVYCWPSTPPGEKISRPCSEILQEREGAVAHHITGNAFRVCQQNGTWLWGNWTDYTECADSYEEYIRTVAEERNLVVAVQHILFIGSFISIICLATAVFIFLYFKCLRCDRVTVHIHLMLALLLRSALLIVITEPFVFMRTSHYRNVDWICKMVLSLNLYSTVASINWMFVQGVYLHSRMTTNVFDREAPLKLYYVIGWVLPFVLVGSYAVTLQTLHPVQCWKNYSERSEIWILLGPMVFALLVNLIFLINIMRILLTKVQRASATTDGDQFRRAVKATLVLFPLLGMNNLLFLYNPGGAFNKYFIIFNTSFGSTQGIFVSIFYCFICQDVRKAIARRYQRFMVRRDVNVMIQRCPSPRENGNSSVVVCIPANNSYRLGSPCITRLQGNGGEVATGETHL